MGVIPEKTNYIALEDNDEITSAEEAALYDEREYIDCHYRSLKKEYEDILSKRRYPDIGPYDTFRTDVQQQDTYDMKTQNKRYEDRAKEVRAYFDCEDLYIGHVNTGGRDYYMTDHNLLATREININGKDVLIVNINDERCNLYVKEWRYPELSPKTVFSRNITMQNKEVEDVYIIRDTRSDVLSDIQDAYLRRILIRNKNQDEINSILQTIQIKQNEIRSMNNNKSFIVQGCAGSGKTIVLLHRLKYLLYNKYLERDNYILLVPSNNFIDYISNISNQFGIHKQNILSYYNCYKRYVTGSMLHADVEEADESTLPSGYLARVYSSQFLRDCCNDVINYYISSAQSLIEKCKYEMSNMIDREVELLTKQEERDNKNLYKNIRNLISSYRKRLIHSEISSMKDIELLLNELRIMANSTNQNDITADIDRIISDIVDQKRSYYESEKLLSDKLETIEDDILQKYFGNSIILFEQIINELSKVHFYESEKFPFIYDILNNIVISGYDVLSRYVKILKRQKKRNTEEINTLIRGYVIFTPNTATQTKECIIHAFDQITRNRIKTEFNIKLNEQHKHYWYLKSYFKYITYGPIESELKYLFIDEAQDLSNFEIKLITAINSNEDHSLVMNLFGDVGQTISEYGIKSWDEIGISDIYHLNENFRNTNQIIDYCKKRLGISMTMVGIDMGDPKEYEDIGEMLAKIDNISELNTCVFIVKSSYRKDDLIQIYNKLSPKYAAIRECSIYTVKECKGLEFKEVFVFDDDMTPNEKYIAYTRALIQLNIIKKFPPIYDTSESERQSRRT